MTERENAGCIVWDWNGTLFDDVPVCVEVENQLLRRRGLPELTIERYREIFTFPVREYYRAAGLDLERESFENLAEEYITAYNAAARNCGLYPGARAVLEELKQAGVVQIIASASARDALAGQVEQCGAAGYFQALLGLGDSLAQGKAGLAKAWLTERNIRLEDVLFVGDTVHDWETARDAGCRCVLIAGGHQSRQRLHECGGTVLENISHFLSSRIWTTTQSDQ